MIELVPFDRSWIALTIKWHSDPEIAEAVGISEKNRNFEDLYDISDNWIKNDGIDVKGVVLNGEPIGYVAFRDINRENKAAVIHVTIANKTLFRKGYGIRACIKMIEYGFNHLELNRVTAIEMGYRPDLIRIMDRNKFGFKREGYIREAVWKDGKPYDMIIYGLLKNDFIKGVHHGR